MATSLPLKLRAVAISLMWAAVALQVQRYDEFSIAKVTSAGLAAAVSAKSTKDTVSKSAQVRNQL